jgi:hypothetical protein
MRLRFRVYGCAEARPSTVVRASAELTSKAINHKGHEGSRREVLGGDGVAGECVAR